MTIRLATDAPFNPPPAGYTGPLYLPGTQRMVWWTGRVAIGLLHRPQPAHSLSREAERIQTLLTRKAS